MESLKGNLICLFREWLIDPGGEVGGRAAPGAPAEKRLSGQWSHQKVHV